MGRSDHLTQLMAALAGELGLQALEFDEDQMCMLQGESGMSLALLLHDSEQSLGLAAGIYPMPEANRAALCEKLLKMNFLLLETQGSTLSIDEEGKEVVVCRQVELTALEPEAFVHQILAFLMKCSELREQIMDLNLTPPGAAPQGSELWISG